LNGDGVVLIRNGSVLTTGSPEQFKARTGTDRWLMPTSASRESRSSPQERSRLNQFLSGPNKRNYGGILPARFDQAA